MKLLFYSLLLVTWLTLQMCQEMNDELDSGDEFNLFKHFLEGMYVDGELEDPSAEDVPVSPNITVYQQIEDRGRFIVRCTDEMWRHSWWSSPKLSVQSDNNFTLEMFQLQHIEYYREVTVSPPVSFTCVQTNHFSGNITELHSETYVFNQSSYPSVQVNKISVSDHCEEGVSSFYIGFVSFIAVCLIIMTAAVIVIAIKSKSKESSTRATNNDYEDAYI